MGKYGKVTGFKAYVKEANSRKSVTFQLWKPVDLVDHMYELVAEYSFAVTSTGVNEVKVFEPQIIPLKLHCHKIIAAFFSELHFNMTKSPLHSTVDK